MNSTAIRCPCLSTVPCAVSSECARGACSRLAQLSCSLEILPHFGIVHQACCFVFFPSAPSLRASFRCCVAHYLPPTPIFVSSSRTRPFFNALMKAYPYVHPSFSCRCGLLKQDVRSVGSGVDSSMFPAGSYDTGPDYIHG
jgi:hypothetical protein